MKGIAFAVVTALALVGFTIEGVDSAFDSHPTPPTRALIAKRITQCLHGTGSSRWVEYTVWSARDEVYAVHSSMTENASEGSDGFGFPGDALMSDANQCASKAGAKSVVDYLPNELTEVVLANGVTM
jgi:hypothetical protein